MPIRRGEIYFVDLDPVVGHELAGTRPVLVLSIDSLNRLPLVVTVIPGTDGANVRRNFQSTVRVPPADSGLPMETVFLCLHLRSLDHGRFPARPAGALGPAWMDRIERSVRYCLGL
ncbi:MAG TPA: type II toxin-antitoxin system PemK/MazF family toxin [Gemmataceae bacterium]